MTATKKILTLLFLLASIFPQSYAAAGDSAISFVHINTSNSNISMNGIRLVFQDSKGFIWVGTHNGLNRYDGIDFTVYDKTALGLISDNIQTLVEDADGNLWVGAGHGLTVYDRCMDTFRPFDKVSDKGTRITNKVNNVCRSRGGSTIYITANGQGLFSYDLQTDMLSNLFFEDGQQTLSQNIHSVYADAVGNLWMGIYYSGLYRWAPGMNLPEKVVGVDGEPVFDEDNITGIAASNNDKGLIYVLSHCDGLCSYNVYTGQRADLLSFPSGVAPIRMYAEDSGENIWIATNNGLYRYNVSSGRHCVIFNDNTPFALSDNYCTALLRDRTGNLWVGTKDSGLNLYNHRQDNFKTIWSVGTTSLLGSKTTDLIQTREGDIYISTESRGLLKCGRDYGKLTSVLSSDLTGMIYSLCVNSGEIWLGTQRGLLRYNPATGLYHRYVSFSTASIDDRVHVVYSTANGRLMVGTTLGLMEYDPKSDRFTSIKSFDGHFVTSVAEDRNGGLYVATYAHGLCYWKDDVVRHYTEDDCALFIDNSKDICVDRYGRVWITCNNSGLCRYDLDSDSFVVYDKKSLMGLKTNRIYSVIDDTRGDIWFGTDVGLVRLNPRTYEVTNYDASVGLLDNDFTSTILRDQYDRLWVGSRNGIMYFDPASLDGLAKSEANIVLTDLKIADTLVKPKADSGLDRNIDIAEEVVLSHKCNSFGVKASLLSWQTLAENRIEYFLEGHDSSVKVLQPGSTAFWYNVRPGTYRLHVRGSTVSDKWDVSHNSIRIVVRQHPLLSPVAVILYVIVVMAILYIGADIYHRRLRKREKQRLIEFERDLEYSVLMECKPTILLLEDDSAQRKMIKSLITDEYNVISAMSLAKSIELAESFRVALIIADADVRNLDAMMFCRKVRENAALVTVPLIILSSDTSSRTRVQYMECGVNIFVEKPLSGEYLKACMKNILNREKAIVQDIEKKAVSLKIKRVNLGEEDEKFINRLDTIFLENFADPDFDTEALIKAMAMSRSSFVRRMKELFATSPNAWLKNKRMTLAAQMLREKGARVNEVCYATGFKYPSYFAKCFKEVYGVLPEEYKKTFK